MKLSDAAKAIGFKSIGVKINFEQLKEALALMDGEQYSLASNGCKPGMPLWIRENNKF